MSLALKKIKAYFISIGRVVREKPLLCAITYISMMIGVICWYFFGDNIINFLNF